MKKSDAKKVDAVASRVAPSPEYDEMKYRAKDAMRDMMRVKEHEKDGALMKRVKQMAAEEAKSCNEIAGYKK